MEGTPDATYYQGETSDSPDLTDTSTENIKKTMTDDNCCKSYNAVLALFTVGDVYASLCKRGCVPQKVDPVGTRLLFCGSPG